MESVNLSQSLALSPAAASSLLSIGTSNAAGVVVVCGFPASGKTTATRLLSGLLDPVVLDKDTFAPQLEESVMSQLTGDPHDRDSDIYRTVVSPHLYAALVRHAATVAEHWPVIIDAPFLGYVRAAASRGVSLAEHIRSIAGAPTVPICAIWLDAAPSQIRARMSLRGADRDQPKLSDWHTYRNAVLDSDLSRLGPAVTDYLVSN
ncbi:AAA family ATPase [Nocardia altamirensis]|uniref:AAA family ATPase n=1 Tax=Nocardia altamirensis TaxID=472158 RepID=UPI000A06ED12|nr:ATP-binding protein [Nocardia altamirensis]